MSHLLRVMRAILSPEDLLKWWDAYHKNVYRAIRAPETTEVSKFLKPVKQNNTIQR